MIPFTKSNSTNNKAVKKNYNLGTANYNSMVIDNTR